MKIRISALAALMVLSAAASSFAQQAPLAADDASSTMQQRLMPENVAKLLAPATVSASSEITQPAHAVMPRGSGTGLMIAGGALFLAGLLIGDDIGTVVAVTGAAIGAYGLYLYFR